MAHIEGERPFGSMLLAHQCALEVRKDKRGKRKEEKASNGRVPSPSGTLMSVCMCALAPGREREGERER